MSRTNNVIKCRDIDGITYAVKIHKEERELCAEMLGFEYMRNKCDNFNLYRYKPSMFQLNIIKGNNINSKYLSRTLYDINYKYDRRMSDKRMLIILKTIRNCFRPNNFFHGNLSFDNILFNKNDHIQFVCLKYSLILSDNNEILETTLINSKLKHVAKNLSKNFFFTYDLIILCTSALKYNFVPDESKYLNEQEFIKIYKIMLSDNNYEDLSYTNIKKYLD